MNNVMRNRERGNVLFLILIAVALFAALGFAVSNILQSGNPTTIAGEQAKVFAGEVLDYGRNMRQAVQGIKISNGCRDTEISFENYVEAGYTNGTNTDCQVFHSDGGAMAWVSPANNINDGSEWVITNESGVIDLGSASPEIILFLTGLNSNICREINNMLGLQSTIIDANDLVDGTWPQKYDGTLLSNQDSITGPTNGCPDLFCGVPAACFTEEDGGELNVFYQVLVAR